MTTRNRGKRSQRASSSRLTTDEDYDIQTSRTPLSISPSSSTESLLAKQQSRPRPLKIVIIGPESVGKTSLRQTYFTNRFQHNYKATIGADFEAKVVEHQASGRKVLLSVWDTAGQERFRALGSAFYRGADAVVVCFDAGDEDEKRVCTGIRDWVEEFRDKSGVEARDFCWVAVGCKADTRGDNAVNRKKIREVLDALIERTGGAGQSGAAPTAATATTNGHGDGPPAKPEEVLSRQGIHKEDDRELGLDNGEREEDAAATPSAVPTAAPSSSHDTPNGSPRISKRTGGGGGLPFPSSTPPKTPQKKTTALPPRERERLDSTISMASSSQLSVYHTPRNSHFFGSTPTGSKRVGGGGNSMLTPSSSVGNIAGWVAKGRQAQPVNGHAQAEDAMTTTSIATPRPAAQPRPRALSTASEQSITSHANVEPTAATARQSSSPPHPTRGFSLYYTSALTGHNVQALFDHIVSRCHTKWTHDEYYSTLQLQRRRRLAEMEKRKLENRRSLWRSTLGRFGSTRGIGAIEMDSSADEEQNRIHNETRRMVRLSDGKADEAQGGCCA